MGIITSIIDAVRKFGNPTQKTALQRQDEQLKGKQVTERRLAVARSELGQTSMFVATTEPVPETVEPLTEEWVMQIGKNAKFADRFAMAFLGEQPGASFLDNLDRAFGAWSEAQDKQGYTNELVVEVLGAAFGCFCVETLDMRWIRVVDADGTAFAIQGRIKDFRAFPYHMIEKRLPAGECGFFKPIYISLQDAARRDWKPTAD